MYIARQKQEGEGMKRNQINHLRKTISWSPYLTANFSFKILNNNSKTSTGMCDIFFFCLTAHRLFSCSLSHWILTTTLFSALYRWRNQGPAEQPFKVTVIGWQLGKEGVVIHLPFLQQAFKSEKWNVLVAQWCPTLYNPKDYSSLSSSVHEILQARILEWLVIPFSRDLPDSRLKPGSPPLQEILYHLSHQGSPEEVMVVVVYCSIVSCSCDSMYCSPPGCSVHGRQQ